MSPSPILPAAFLKKDWHFALADASNDRAKEGFHIYAAMKQAGFSVFPIHPTEYRIQGDPGFPNLTQVRPFPDAVILCTMVPETRGMEIVREMRNLGIFRLWVEPEAENKEILKFAEEYRFQLVIGYSLRNELHTLREKS